MARDHFKQAMDARPYFADFNTNNKHECKAWACRFEKFIDRFFRGK